MVFLKFTASKKWKKIGPSEWEVKEQTMFYEEKCHAPQIHALPPFQPLTHNRTYIYAPLSYSYCALSLIVHSLKPQKGGRWNRHLLSLFSP